MVAAAEQGSMIRPVPQLTRQQQYQNSKLFFLIIFFRQAVPWPLADWPVKLRDGSSSEPNVKKERNDTQRTKATQQQPKRVEDEDPSLLLAACDALGVDESGRGRQLQQEFF